MPSGLMPTYGYVPATSTAQPTLRTCSSLRARLFAGGTYFRVREPGSAGNSISIAVIEFSGPATSQPDGICIVTNYVVDTQEMVSGPAKIQVLTNRLPFDLRVVIDQLTTDARARVIRISSQIAPLPDEVLEESQFRFSRPFVRGNELVAKVTPGTPVFTPGDEIVITPRHRIYRLSPITVTEPDTGSGPPVPQTGWDIADLRAKVNASDPWIEMLPRSGPTDDGMGGPPVLNPNPADVQDEGVDETFLTTFDETFLTGGDGLPDTPAREHTGPTRSLVHINYGEQQNGSLGEVNTVYEWAGESAIDGAWRTY
jgi:hypothetical protein